MGSVAEAAAASKRFLVLRHEASLKHARRRIARRLVLRFLVLRHEASLKQVDMHGGIDDGAGFLVLRHEASLKRDAQSRQRPAVEFPRASARGLIEAVRARRGLPRRALFPRASARGLIEASPHTAA